MFSRVALRLRHCAPQTRPSLVRTNINNADPAHFLITARQPRLVRAVHSFALGHDLEATSNACTHQAHQHAVCTKRHMHASNALLSATDGAVGDFSGPFLPSDSDAAETPRAWKCKRCQTANPPGVKNCSSCGMIRAWRNSWKCSLCDEVNGPRMTECVSCGTKKPEHVAARKDSARMWRCPSCNRHNERDHAKCAQCGDSSPYMMPGDWACTECNMHNFAKNRECAKCHTPRDKHQWKCSVCDTANAGERAMCTHCGHMKALLPGDWACPSCLAHNFKRKKECFSCGKPKPGEAFEQASFWDCPKCGKNNPMWSGVCAECSFRRPKDNPMDWLCIKCGCVNFRKRAQCFKCDAPRPTEWTCSECGTYNFAKRSACFSCTAPRKI